MLIIWRSVEPPSRSVSSRDIALVHTFRPPCFPVRHLMWRGTRLYWVILLVSSRRMEWRLNSASNPATGIHEIEEEGPTFGLCPSFRHWDEGLSKRFEGDVYPLVALVLHVRGSGSQGGVLATSLTKPWAIPSFYPAFVNHWFVPPQNPIEPRPPINNAVDSKRTIHSASLFVKHWCKVEGR